MKTLADKIRHLRPCREATDWLSGYNAGEEEKAWRECQRGDWMMWLLGTQAGPPGSDGRKKLVLAACDCNELLLSRAKDQRVMACIETAREWAAGEATVEQLREAEEAAYLATRLASNHLALADAACFAYRVIVVASNTVDQLFLVNDIGTAKTQCADIVRKHYQKPPKISRPK